MPSEIGGLEPMTGYIKVGNNLAQLAFTFENRPAREPAFIERPLVTVAAPVRETPPVEPAAAVTPGRAIAPGRLG